MSKMLLMKKSVQKADVYIYNLLGKGTGIVVDLDVIARLDKDIHKILYVPKIDVLITQTSGETKAKVTLDIKFLPLILMQQENLAHKSNFKLSDVEMYTKEAFISLDNYLVYLDKTNMRYKKIFLILPPQVSLMPKLKNLMEKQILMLFL